jgi:hypothetical protein
VKTTLVNRLPVPVPPKADRLDLEERVRGIQSLIVQGLPLSNAAKQQIEEIQVEIDARVEFLYFHADEAATYDEWVAKQGAERGTAIEEVRKLIAGGESGTVEFKQSLEYVDPAGYPNVPEAHRTQRIKADQSAVVHAALKTLCAFLNSKGGTLLLGVRDDGGIAGIEPDYALCGKKPNRDGFELKLTDLIKMRFKPLPTALEVRFVEVDGKTVCRVDAPSSAAATYLENRLYVRLGNSTEELTGRDLQDWLMSRGRPA